MDVKEINWETEVSRVSDIVSYYLSSVMVHIPQDALVGADAIEAYEEGERTLELYKTLKSVGGNCY